MLAASALIDRLYACDHAILEWIAGHLRCGFLDFVMPIITFLGNAGWFWILCALLLLCFRRTRKTGWMVALALVCGLLVCNLGLKPLIHRIRPYDLWNVEITLVKKPTDFSFPSGHTIASFEAAVVLMLRERKRFGWAALALAVLIAFSRLYLYVHYPSDVFAAILLGTLFAFFSVWLVSLLYRKAEKKKGQEK